MGGTLISFEVIEGFAWAKLYICNLREEQAFTYATYWFNWHLYVNPLLPPT
jgi:hypothetical protein